MSDQNQSGKYQLSDANLIHAGVIAITTKMAFKFRIYPSRPQIQYLNDCIRSCWWFYRYVLHHYEDDYKYAKQEYGKHVLSWYYGNVAYHPYWLQVKITKSKIPKDCYLLGAPIRHQGIGVLSTYKLLQRVRRERPYLMNIPAIVLQEVLERVAHAFDKFWKEGGGYPNYPKEKSYNSVTWTDSDNIKLYTESSALLRLSKVPGLIKITLHRVPPGKIKRVTISKDILGQFYASIVCEYGKEPEPARENNIIGIDMNIKAIDDDSRSFIAMSDGTKVDIPRWYSLCLKKLAKLQRDVAKCERGTHDWYRANRRVKHLYEDVQNKRNEWLHKLTANLKKTFTHVVIEDMTLTGFHKKKNRSEPVDNMQLAADRGVRKAWTETPFGEFKRLLKYKIGDGLICVDPKYTSKTCNVCGFVNEDLTLSDREWACPKCKTQHDRDVNAAINIRNRGIVFLKGPIKR